jgi:glutamyl-tRNA synthetase
MEYITEVVALVKGRINFVKDLWEQSRFFFVAPTEYEAKSIKKRWSAEMPDILTELTVLLQELPSLSPEDAEKPVLKWIGDKGYHLGNVMNAFRLTVVGECKGPHMFEITRLLGTEETIRRIRLGVERIQQLAD